MENAFKHGILPLEKKKRGQVKISVQLCGEEIHFEIKNNGTQIEPQKLSEMQNSLKQNYIPENTHIGLLNVNSRIKLIFSNDYGCEIDSDENETTVIIKFPIIKDNP